MSEPAPLILADTRPSWITPALLALTVRVWSKRYGRPVDASEAASILQSVGRLIDVLKPRFTARARAERSIPNPL